MHEGDGCLESLNGGVEGAALRIVARWAYVNVGRDYLGDRRE